LVDLAVSSGVIEKRGPWFYYGGEKYQGLKSLVHGLSDDHLESVKNDLIKTELVFNAEEDD